MSAPDLCVYLVRMARVNVYLPDDLAAEARAAGLNVSAITQQALREALEDEAAKQWFAEIARLKPIHVDHDDVIAAVHAAREEFER